MEGEISKSFARIYSRRNAEQTEEPRSRRGEKEKRDIKWDYEGHFQIKLAFYHFVGRGGRMKYLSIDKERGAPKKMKRKNGLEAMAAAAD